MLTRPKIFGPGKLVLGMRVKGTYLFPITNTREGMLRIGTGEIVRTQDEVREYGDGEADNCVEIRDDILRARKYILIEGIEVL